MRQIQFRAKDNDGKWVYGYLDFNEDDNEYFIRYGSNSIFDITQVHKNTICQYVMTVKGNRIYEKDVLLQWGQPYVVEWSEWDDQQGYNIALDDNDLEVVGNLIDTPDILKKYEK